MINFNEFQCAIFDLDGTILDSTGIWERVDQEFLGRRGIPVPQDYMQSMKLHNFESGALYTMERFGLSEKPEDIVKEWFQMAIEEYTYHIQMKPYAKTVLEKLKDRGMKLAVATSSDRTLYTPCLKRNEIYDLFDCFVQTSDVERGKEFSDVYEEAARRCGISVDRCIVFEDILGAVKAAKSGGFYTVAVADEASLNERNEINAVCDVFLHDYGAIMQDLIL